MTDSIPLSALPGPQDHTRRDQYGRYLVLPPSMDKPTGYTRATTVAKALDDEAALGPWNATHAICGQIMRRSLRARWETILATYGSSPWYGGVEAKRACKALVRECATAGGADERRETGTSLHALTALVDLGRPPVHLTEETERDLRAYSDALFQAGVQVIADYVETTVVLDEWRVAGTFDRLVTVMGFERPLIADLKTGSDLSYSWRAIAVQLAIYAHGDEIYRQGVAPDGSEDERLPMPVVDQDNALVIWLDTDKGTCSLWLVDIRQGWEAFEHSMWARSWRKRDVAHPLADGPFVRATADEDLVPALKASVAELARRGIMASGDAEARVVSVETGGRRYEPAPGGGMVDVGPAGEPVDDARAEARDEDEDHTPAVRAWLQERIDAIGAHPRARADLAASWPLASTLQTQATHSPDELDLMATTLDQVERRHKIPFPEPRPGVDLLATVLKIFPGTVEA
jgi:hypothetical protein